MVKIPKRPEFLLLGIDLRQLERQDRTLTWYMLAAATVVYSSHWKQRQTPKMSEWIRKLLFYAVMDKITRELREQNENGFREDWRKLRTYLNNKWESKIIS